MAPTRQALAWVLRPEALMARGRAECGPRFTLHLPVGPAVVVSDPEAIRAVFSADPEVFRAGEGNRPLEPVLGPASLLLLDGPEHLRRRRLVLPPLHGARLRPWEEEMRAATERDVASWPRGRPFPLEPRMRAITLDVILRLVFGVGGGALHDELRARLGALLPPGMARLALLPALRRELGGRSPWARLMANVRAVDGLLLAEIAARRAAGDLAERGDVLSLLVAARDEDGAPLSDRELRDELMTLLLAGHETTATALSWAFELLFRHPAAYAELRARLDDDAAVDAVATEVLRLRPPLTIVARRLARDAEVAGLALPAGTMVAPCIWLAHRDPERYPDPLAFRPERWAGGRRPETLSWLPFGGGSRRCVGAAFAQLELRTVLRTVVRLAFPAPAEPGPDGSRRRAVVVAPARGARAVVA